MEMKLEEYKTILYIGGFELPDKNAAAQRVIANGKIFKALGYNVVFVGFDKSLKGTIELSDTKKSYEGFTYYSLKYPQTISEWLKYLVSITEILQFVDTNVSHVIAYNYPGIALLRLRKYCKNRKIKLVADCTEWYEAKGNLMFKIIKGLDVYLRMYIAHPRLDGLIVISDYLFNFYENKVKSLINLPPLVDLSMDKWKHLDNSIDENVVNLIYAGSPAGKQKDRLDSIINALNDIRSETSVKFHFNIVGLTISDYIRFYGEESIPENSKEFISFKGRISHLEVLREIAKSDYEIFIRYNNLTNTAGFPTKFVEAISCGTPVLANSSSNISQYLIVGKTGFLLNADTQRGLRDTLSESISRKKTDIIEMKTHCRQSVVFDYKNYIQRVVVFLDSLN